MMWWQLALVNVAAVAFLLGVRSVLRIDRGAAEPPVIDDALDADGRWSIYEVPDIDLPGMWESSDFMGEFRGGEDR